MEDAKGKRSTQNDTEALTYHIEIGRADIIEPFFFSYLSPILIDLKDFLLIPHICKHTYLIS